MLTLSLALLLAASPAHAADAPAAPAATTDKGSLAPFKGRLISADASGRGMITIDSQNIEIEVHKLFGESSDSYALADVRALHVSRGLFHTTVVMDMKDKAQGQILLRTSPKRYTAIKTALKNRITKG